jgi:hypothetical protein
VREPGDAAARLARLDRAAGPAARNLRTALGSIRFEGLAETQARAIDERWGGFARPPSGEAGLVVRCVGGDGEGWLPRWRPGERYRLEAGTTEGSDVLVRSYHFAMMPLAGPVWRLAIEETPDEPSGRILDNAARYLVARLALLRSGLAFHGAGLYRKGRAWIFAGPSGAGKTTAVALSGPAESLGDDFAVAVPHGGGWATCALPFDNAERAAETPVEGLLPLARVCRLYQAPEHRLERPHGVMAQASLLACVAFPWAIPDLAERAADAVAALATSGTFVHLRFARDPGFWRLLECA